MAFIPGEDEWCRSHFYDVPNQTVEFCGDLSGVHLLNVGCGDMLADFGLLAVQVRSIVGLDIKIKGPEHLQRAAARLTEAGFTVPSDYNSRISYICYDGRNFPFHDESFDMVFSWSAFEHINDVPKVLQEIRRVLRASGRAFIQVFPWFHCRYGSHLTDFIDEPYFHLRRPSDWVASQLQVAAGEDQDRRKFLDEMLSEYKTLNQYSANTFYRETRKAGFSTLKAQAIVFQEDLSQAPEDIDFSELLICGSKLLLQKQSA
jgi:ubiquinone/menaquinone biosynthesis C-methylase UbiE